MRLYCVYILASVSRRLYVGVTNDLARRVWQHRSGSAAGFTARYHIHRLVYFECGREVHSAVAREKEIKGWSRPKKMELIEAANEGWNDLATSWFAAPRALRPRGQ